MAHVRKMQWHNMCCVSNDVFLGLHFGGVSIFLVSILRCVPKKSAQPVFPTDVWICLMAGGNMFDYPIFSPAKTSKKTSHKKLHRT